MISIFAIEPVAKQKLKTLAQRLTIGGSYLLAGWIVFAGIEIHNLATTSRQWASAQQNMVMIEKVFSDLKDCESGQRGYIITGDTDYLAQFNSGSASLNYDRDVMSAYLAPQPGQRASVAELDKILDAKITEMQVALQAFDRDGFAAAQAVIRTNRGALQMKHIRYLMDVIRAREQGAMKQSGLLSLLQ